jgi:hypothetical protein
MHAQILRLSNRHAFARSRCSGQECGFFGQAVHYDARGARMVQMVAWADCRTTGGFRCLDAGQLQWPPAGALHRRRPPAGPDQPRKTVFGFCGFAGAGLTLTGAAHSLACLRTGLLA